MVVGDSQSYMLGRPFKKQGRKLGYKVFHKGKPGSATMSWVQESWIGKRLKMHKPNLVIISSGTNDAGGIIARKKFPANADKIVARVHKTGAKIIWVIPPQNKVRVRHLMDWVREHSTADAVFDTTCMDIKLSDGVHPTLKEARRWADAVWKFVLEGKDPCNPSWPGGTSWIVERNSVGFRWRW
jgi:lysophospholipase L1-like esterase